MTKNLKRVVALALINLTVIAQASTLTAQVATSPKSVQTTAPMQQIDSVDDVLAPGLYGVYVEVRPGTITSQIDQFQKFFLPLIPLIEEDTKSKFPDPGDLFTRLFAALGSAKTVIAALPTKSSLPAAVVMSEFPTEEQAADFDEKLPETLRQIKAYAAALDAQDKKSTTKKTASDKIDSPFPDKIFTRRAGKVLVMSDKAFELKALRPDNAPRLADDRMFQSARGRFSSSAGFMYLDAISLSYGIEELSKPKPVAKATAGKTTTSKSTARNKSAAITKKSTTPPSAKSDDASSAIRELLPEKIPGLEELNSTIAPFGAVLPAAAAIGFTVNGDYYGYSAQFIPAAPTENVGLIPVLSQPIAGPATSFKAAALLPADTDVLVSASVDWLRTYDKIDALVKAYLKSLPADNPDKKKANDEAAEIGAAAMDQNLGFKLRSDLLGVLGNEISVGVTGIWSSVSLDDIGKDPSAVLNKVDPSKLDYYVILSLKDKDAMESVLPRLFEGVDIKRKDVPPDTSIIGDVSVTSYPNLSYAIIDNCLILAKDAKSIGRVIEARTSGKSLASNSKFTESFNWTANSALAQAYVSDGLMKSLIASARKTAETNHSTRVVSLIDSLHIEPMPITSAILADPIAPVYEVRSPLQILYTVFLSALAEDKKTTADDKKTKEK